MGLFKKFKKDNTKKDDLDFIETQSILIDDEKKIQLEKELDDLQEKIKEKNVRLNIILEKIELSKNEYNDIVSNIIQSKKDLQTQKKETPNHNQFTELNEQDIEKISKELNLAKNELDDVKKEIKMKLQINKELEDKISKNKPVILDSETQKKKIDNELEQRNKELEVVKKKILDIKESNIKNHSEKDSKNVVEAASQIVATTNKRLEDTIKELGVIRQLLDKERKAHKETKKKLQNYL